MPWGESSVSNERMRFIAALLDGGEMAETCRQFGISRKTGYKWWNRYDRAGPGGLKDLSRAPHECPHRVEDELVRRILELRRQYPRWGPKKLKKKLETVAPNEAWPSRTTFAEILKRHGLVAPRRRRRRVPAYQQPFIGAGEPNAIWTADFKGDFQTGDRTRCYPLTIADCCSRFLLRCQALTGTATEQCAPIFEAAFKEYGMPLAIRTDNGAPFAARGFTGLTRLSVWFIKLGIVPERIEPGHPEQNGRHERMHRTLKEETAAPPKATFSLQQKAFNAFRDEFNHERPHEGLDMETPASIYAPSPRPFPRRIEPVTYDHSVYEVRKVTGPGVIAFDKRTVFISRALAGEHVGLRYRGSSTWIVRYKFVDLALLDMRQLGKHIRLQPLPPDLSWDAETRIHAGSKEI